MFVIPLFEMRRSKGEKNPRSQSVIMRAISEVCMQKISVCILVKNAQETLQECLESVRGFDEIILLDNGSTDSTLEIAREFQKSFGALRIESSKFLGFGALKHLAVSYARNDWVFVLDSDEVVESCVYQELESLEFARNHIYALARKNLYN